MEGIESLQETGENTPLTPQIISVYGVDDDDDDDVSKVDADADSRSVVRS